MLIDYICIYIYMGLTFFGIQKFGLILWKIHQLVVSFCCLIFDVPMANSWI